MDRSRLLEDEAAQWRALGDVYERIPDDRFEEPSVTPEGWSPKDVMFHLAAWMQDCATQLERMRLGTFDPGEETREAIDRQNDEWFDRSRTMDPQEVRARLEPARRRMVEGLASMPEVTPLAWEWFEESGPLHLAKHVNDLEAWLG